MNPERIYSQYHEDALAAQITSTEYSTFVAMPFAERNSYPSQTIFQSVIMESIKAAASSMKGGRGFAKPFRADLEPELAAVITEDIVVRILKSHFFVADLTFNNPGVILELGIALGMKPVRQIIVLTQDPIANLHFNIEHNRVISYNGKDAIDRIRKAFVSGAEAFEADATKRIRSISKTLTPAAIIALNFYGRIWRDYAKDRPSLHDGIAERCFPGENSFIRFRAATSELLFRKLIWCDYNVGAIPGGDAFGMHATRLGWAIISKMWSELVMPESAPTG